MKAIGHRTSGGSRFNVQSVVSGPVTQEYNPAQRAAGGVLRRQLIDRLPTDEEKFVVGAVEKSVGRVASGGSTGMPESAKIVRSLRMAKGNG